MNRTKVEKKYTANNHKAIKKNSQHPNHRRRTVGSKNYRCGEGGTFNRFYWYKLFLLGYSDIFV